MHYSFTGLLIFFTSIFFPAFANAQTQTDSSRITFTLANFYFYNPRLEQKVDEYFNKLTDNQRVGQMIIQAAGKLGKSTETITRLVREQ